MGLLNNNQEQPQQEQQSNSSYQIAPRVTPNPSPPTQDFFKYRIQSEDVLEEIEHKLKGEVFDFQKKEWVVKYGRWCNDDGVNIILAEIYDYANKNVYLGNLDRDQINFKCNKLKRQLARLLFNKYTIYEINKTKRSLLIKKVVDSVHSSLSRCEDGKEADQLSTSTQRHEISNFQQQEEKKSMLNPLRFFKGGK